MQESSGWESLARGARVQGAYVRSIGSGELESGKPTQGSMTSRDIGLWTGEPCTVGRVTSELFWTMQIEGQKFNGPPQEELV